MAKDKQKEVKPETEVKASEETLQGVGAGMGVYKPLPRFRSGCNNC